MAKTLLQLRTLVRRRADIENDGNHISDAEIDDLINDGVENLWYLLGDLGAANLFAVQAPALTALGNNSFLLPNNFNKLVEVSVKAGGSYYRSEAADPESISYLADESGDLSDYASRHYLHWNIDQARAELFVYPAPANTKLSVRYIPSPPDLSLDTDVLPLPDGYHQWVVWDAVVACLQKREQDPRGAASEREKVEARIRGHVDSMEVTRAYSIRRSAGTLSTLPDAGRG